jgi:hypothetical protein
MFVWVIFILRSCEKQHLKINIVSFIKKKGDGHSLFISVLVLVHLWYFVTNVPFANYPPFTGVLAKGMAFAI